MKSSTYYFHIKIKILADFQICISVTLTHLSKAFDFLKLDLLIAKLTDYGFDSQPLNYTFHFLSGTPHRTEINNAYSNYLIIIFGVTEGSISGLHSSIFIRVICFSRNMTVILPVMTLMITIITYTILT